MTSDDYFKQLQEEVIYSGLCSHCGTCVGLSQNTLAMRLTDRGPLPVDLVGKGNMLGRMAYLACPGRGLNYPSLNEFVFNNQPANYLIGNYDKFYIAYSKVPEIRLRGASAGVITQTLIYLLANNIVDGIVVLRHGWPKPWLSTPFITRKIEDVIAASQSVYIPTSVNTILAEMEYFDGRMAFVGLPDQVASLRMLQQLGHPAACKVNFVLGPYVGTIMYLEAVMSFLRSNGIRNIDEVTRIRYREGEWPGHLEICLRSGKILRSHKFYYNYLIPFYITQSSLLSVDFTNELTDISVGDAWHTHYESMGKGYSVVIARSEKGSKILSAMESEGLIALEEIKLEDVLSMHSHMIDFKKRGAFIRIHWRRILGQRVPKYGYQPKNIPFSRVLVEIFISGLFVGCSTYLARSLMELIPVNFLGPIFNLLRRMWKSISKPVKRRGLMLTSFRLDKQNGTKGNQ